MLIDTHTHIYLEEFDEDRSQIINNCKDLDINQLLLPNIDFSSLNRLIDTCNNYQGICSPMVGLHPCSVKSNFENELNKIKPFIETLNPVAIGEIGIDLYWDKTTLDIQKHAFIEQINWAKEYKLPIVIHARESYNEIFEILDEINDETLFGVFHCFSSSLADANRIINYGGFKLGIGGVVTFKNSGLDQTLKNVSIDNLVLETDSPYLTPTPFRGKRNNSSYLKLIADKLTEIYQLSPLEIAKKTSKNAKEIFKI
jgi:TatD DNase family protein